MNVSLGGRTGRWMAGAATAFLVLPMALAAPASAAVAVDRTPDRQVEQSQNAPENNPAFWVGENGSTECWKHESGDPIDGGSHGKVLASDKSVWQMGTPPTGKVFSLLVLKSATMNDVFYDPTPGALYGTVSGKNISHVIVCKKPAPQRGRRRSPDLHRPDLRQRQHRSRRDDPGDRREVHHRRNRRPGRDGHGDRHRRGRLRAGPRPERVAAHVRRRRRHCAEPTEVTPQVTFTDPTCDNDNTASWTGEADRRRHLRGHRRRGRPRPDRHRHRHPRLRPRPRRGRHDHVRAHLRGRRRLLRPSPPRSPRRSPSPTRPATTTTPPPGPARQIDGVTYALTDGEVGPGQTVTVTATLDDDLVLAEGATTTFEHTFAAAEEDCNEQPPAIEVAFKDAGLPSKTRRT